MHETPFCLFEEANRAKFACMEAKDAQATGASNQPDTSNETKTKPAFNVAILRNYMTKVYHGPSNARMSAVDGSIVYDEERQPKTDKGRQSAALSASMQAMITNLLNCLTTDTQVGVPISATALRNILQTVHGACPSTSFNHDLNQEMAEQDWMLSPGGAGGGAPHDRVICNKHTFQPVYFDVGKMCRRDPRHQVALQNAGVLTDDAGDSADMALEYDDSIEVAPLVPSLARPAQKRGRKRRRVQQDSDDDDGDDALEAEMNVVRNKVARRVL